MALLIKPGVDFGTSLSPAGARILEVLKALSTTHTFDITITSARDGVHRPGSAHYTGEAFDLRTHGLSEAQKGLLLNDLARVLYKEHRRFFAFLEAPGAENEHIHVQRRSATPYSVLDYLQNA